MKKTPLAVTACRVLTPLDDVRTGRMTWDRLCAGERVGERVSVDDAWLNVEEGVDRSILLALAAARGVVPADGLPANTGLFCGTSKGPVLTYLGVLETMRRGGEGRWPSEEAARHVMLGVGGMGAELAQRLELGRSKKNGDGPVHTSVGACASGLAALHRAAEAVWRDECAAALVVAADASLHALFEGSFQRLGVMAPAKEIEGQRVRRCMPFSDAGEGFFVIEGAAAIVLEKPRDKRRPLAWLEESWIGGDGTGLIAIDEKAETLRRGLSRMTDIPAFVHAHATGTSHDRFELAAIRQRWAKTPVFSCKEFLGHSLGAAGLISVGVSLFSHANGQTHLGLNVARDARSVTIAQGFGGHVAVVGLAGPDRYS